MRAKKTTFSYNVNVFSQKHVSSFFPPENRQPYYWSFLQQQRQIIGMKRSNTKAGQTEWRHKGDTLGGRGSQMMRWGKPGWRIRLTDPSAATEEWCLLYSTGLNLVSVVTGCEMWKREGRKNKEKRKLHFWNHTNNRTQKMFSISKSFLFFRRKQNLFFCLLLCI